MSAQDFNALQAFAQRIKHHQRQVVNTAAPSTASHRNLTLLASLGEAAARRNAIIDSLVASAPAAVSPPGGGDVIKPAPQGTKFTAAQIQLAQSLRAQQQAVQSSLVFRSTTCSADIAELVRRQLVAEMVTQTLGQTASSAPVLPMSPPSAIGQDIQPLRRTRFVVDAEQGVDPRYRSKQSFPEKIYFMLEQMEREGKEDAVSFVAKGTAFLIRKPRVFEADIMPLFFSSRRMSSFQRQLNIYGFTRINEGPNRGAYRHCCFVKGKKHLLEKIKRPEFKKHSSKSP